MWFPEGRGLGEGRTGSLRLADVNYYIQDGYTTRFYCIDCLPSDLWFVLLGVKVFHMFLYAS